MPDQKLSVPRAIIFSIFGAVTPFAYVPYIPTATFAVAVVAKYYGFDLVSLGVALAIITICDSIWDPAIGVASDRFRTRWGNRRPWIAVGVVMTVVSGLLLYYPREEMSVLTFVAIFALFNFTASLYEVPYRAWATSATSDVSSRNRLYFIIPLVGWTASAGLIALPLLPVFETNELTVHVLTLSVMIFGVLSVPALYLLFRFIPDEVVDSKPTQNGKNVWKDLWLLIRVNPPFRYLVLVNFIAAIGSSAGGSLFFFWFDSYLGMGEHVSALGFSMLVPGILAPFFGIWITKRFSRNTVYASASLAIALSGVINFSLTPDTPGLFAIVLVTAAVFGGGLGTLTVSLTRALYADIVDYGRLKAGIEGGGTYISAELLVSKIQSAVLGSLGLIVVGLFGFVPDAETQSETAILALRIVVAGFPIVFSALAAVMMFYFPLDTRRMSIIGKRLRQLSERSARAQTAADSQAIGSV